MPKNFGENVNSLKMESLFKELKLGSNLHAGEAIMLLSRASPTTAPKLVPGGPSVLLQKGMALGSLLNLLFNVTK